MTSTQKAIPFCRPYVSGKELPLVAEVVQSGHFAGPGPFGKKCEQVLEELLGTSVLLTSSCTHALEMAALLADIGPGDEVIMPSFTFVSSANAFVLRGATPIFVDLLPGDMNVSPEAIAAAVGPNTKAILIMHYAGAACAMEAILEIARQHKLILIEDAAHCIGASYKGQPLGTFGDIGTLSFHETKNIQCGEGGALILNRPDWLEKARQIREKGTNRPAFDRGAVSFYEWTEVGSSYLLGEIPAAFLYAQLEELESITQLRRKLYDSYQEVLSDLVEAGHIKLPRFAEGAFSNGHIAYLKVGSREIRDALSAYLRNRGISAYFHYVPLHSSAGGKKYGRFHGEDRYTSIESDRLLRLPIYPGLEESDLEQVGEVLRAFFRD